MRRGNRAKAPVCVERRSELSKISQLPTDDMIAHAALEAGSRRLGVLETVAVAEGTPEVPELLPRHLLKPTRRARTEPLSLLALGLRRSTRGRAVPPSVRAIYRYG